MRQAEDQLNNLAICCYDQRSGPVKDGARMEPCDSCPSAGARHVLVSAVPNGPIWKNHMEQLKPQYGVEEDDDPGEVLSQSFLAFK